MASSILIENSSFLYNRFLLLTRNHSKLWEPKTQWKGNWNWQQCTKQQIHFAWLFIQYLSLLQIKLSFLNQMFVGIDSKTKPFFLVISSYPNSMPKSTPLLHIGVHSNFLCVHWSHIVIGLFPCDCQTVTHKRKSWLSNRDSFHVNIKENHVSLLKNAEINKQN